MNLAGAAAALHKATVGFNGGWVTVSRPSSGGTVQLQAVFGKSNIASDSSAPGRVEAVSEDFIVVATDYRFGGAVVEPLEGDQVTRVINGVTMVFELMVPPYTPSDSAGVRLRLHSKLVSNQGSI